MNVIRNILCAAILFLPAAAAQTPEEQKRFEEIRARRERGDEISAEDRAWAMRHMQQRNQGAKGSAQNPQQLAEWAKAHPPRESTGLVPLSDLGRGMYQGFQGGLYPNGQNTPPPAHLKAGLALAKAIVPLDAEGRKSDDGKVVLLSIGMSNTTMEFQTFQKIAAQDPGLNPKLVIVDGAQGGQTARITGTPDSNFWNVVSARLNKTGVTPQQVQVAWLKQANAGPSEGFPEAAKKLQADVVETLHNLHDKFPNLKITYLSSRIYGGYALTPLNPEPYAYEGGFSMKWVIGDQIAAKPELNYDPARGTVRSPWVAWGPDLWTDGVKGRKQDSVVWLKDDVLEKDRTHPSDSGREKVAKLLLDFLKSDPTARPWFTGR